MPTSRNGINVFSKIIDSKLFTLRDTYKIAAFFSIGNVMCKSLRGNGKTKIPTTRTVFINMLFFGHIVMNWIKETDGAIGLYHSYISSF